ncbi:MAG: sodium:alanine symporter family protein [Oscillospiraceae bacterium]|nr:sodium:alanine symporter family protein [Oscillospiraceae bacterium]
MEVIVEHIKTVNDWLNHIVWGAPAMVLILAAGLLLSVMTRFPQFVHFGYAIRNTIGKAFEKKTASAGAVSPFKAMCTALAASLGTGNIAGVSGAIAIGGPGAVFWMWCSALLGMCTKYSEVTLAIRYRERNARGEWVGGPMYYIKNGLGRRWHGLACFFALLGGVACFGIGNMTQVNTIASTVNSAVGQFITTDAGQQKRIALAVGILCAAVIAVVLLGGVGRIADVCAALVPAMAIVYFLASLAVIAINISAVPAAFAAIFTGAFRPPAVAGGLAGVGIRTVIQMGVGRGIFSNEAGLGSAPIAHAAADVDHPVRQGLYGIFEVFIDTVVVCTVTALVVLLGNGVENIGYGTDMGAQLTVNGFRSVFGGPLPAVLVAICLSLFALSTILSWGLYGVRCWEFLAGPRSVRVFQGVFVLFVVVGAVIRLDLAWGIADTLNGLMAIPNLMGVILLSPEVSRLTREYFRVRRRRDSR